MKDRKLPPPPAFSRFKNQIEYDEALGFWRSRVGRIRGMAASQTDRFEDSPETSQDSDQPPTSK